jgi:hypothetical protein
MRLLIVGTLGGQLTAASKIAMQRGLRSRTPMTSKEH